MHSSLAAFSRSRRCCCCLEAEPAESSLQRMHAAATQKAITRRPKWRWPLMHSSTQKLEVETARNGHEAKQGRRVLDSRPRSPTQTWKHRRLLAFAKHTEHEATFRQLQFEFGDFSRGLFE